MDTIKYIIGLFVIAYSIAGNPKVIVSDMDTFIYKSANLFLIMGIVIPAYIFHFKKSKNNFGKGLISILILVVCIFCFFAIDSRHSNEYREALKNYKLNSSYVLEDKVRVHYIDVGQGDATFIELGNGECMLIDAGDSYAWKNITTYISSLGYKKIDYLVGTHPHNDHIGSMAKIIKSFDIGKIYMPKAVGDTSTYTNLLRTISKNGLKVKDTKAGMTIVNDGFLSVDVLAPNSDYYEELNNYSIVLKLTYGNNKFLFMGDAEELSESEIVGDVSADVLKVGHHGSNTSSSVSFLERVKPKYAIISVGANNDYYHPHGVILKRLDKIGAKIYRTDLNGNIVITSDGNNIKIEVEK